MEKIEECTGLAKQTIQLIEQRARERGYNKNSNHMFERAWFINAAKSGCPRLMNEEEKKDLMKRVELNCDRCKINTMNLGGELDVFQLTVWRAL